MAKANRYYFKAAVSLVLTLVMAMSMSVSAFASAATDRVKQQYGFSVQIGDTSMFTEDFAIKLIDKSFEKLPKGFVKALTEQERIISEYNNIIIFTKSEPGDGDSLGYITSDENGDYYIKILTTEDTGTLTHEFGHYFSNYLTETLGRDTEKQWTALNGGESYVGEGWEDLEELTGNAAKTFVTTYAASEFVEDFGEVFRVMYYNTSELQPFLADASSPIAKKVDFMKKLVADTVKELDPTAKTTTTATDSPAVTVPSTSATAEAKPASATVLIDGKQVKFEAYNIEGSNYFKLRDVAMALAGTEVEYSVGYDNATSSITIGFEDAYKPVGGELSVSTKSTTKKATLSNAKVIVDGESEQFTAYNIDGNNYFKIRELAECIDFAIGYDQKTNTVTIDTTRGF